MPKVNIVYQFSHVEQKKARNEEKVNIRKERYNGKMKRRDWQEESEEAKKIRLEKPVDRVKRRKSLILLGYSGVNYIGMQRNPEVATIEEELLKAMLEKEWITEEGYKIPQQIFFQRSARTDKGVSAARQVVSLKLPEETDIAALNASLPEDIKVFAVKRVTKGFNSKTTCDSRSYSYTLPSYSFTNDDEDFQETSFRLSSERLEKLNNILKLYIGTKNFHNFTIRKEFTDPSAKRFIISFSCEKPFVPDNTEVEFVRLKIKGQSFMMHQIRKMVGLVIAIMRDYKEPGIIEQAVRKERILVPQAPGLGLVLDNVHYDRYNERYGSDGHGHQALTFQDEEKDVEEFFKTKIMSTIINTELGDGSMKRWIGRLKTHEYEKVDEVEKERSDKDGYLSD